MKRWLFGLALLAAPAVANPRLPHVLGDHMVVQQGREVRLWGWADPGERMTASMLGHRQSTVTDAAGRWQVSLPPAPVGGPYLITIAGKTTLTLKDVLSGEVWVASGQSNMSFSLKSATGADEAIRHADLPGIRFFTVPRHIATTPQENTLPATWEVSAPDTAGEFSAVAWFFARQLYQTLGVPVGILHTSWPGTAAEEWTSPQALANGARLKPIVDNWKRGDRTFDDHPPHFDMEFDDFELVGDQGAVPFSDFNSGQAVNAMGGSWLYDWKGAPATTFELSPTNRGLSAHISGSIDHAARSLLTTWYAKDESPVDMSKFSAFRFRVRGHGLYRIVSLQPDIVDWDDYSTQKPLQATPDWRQVTISFKDLQQSGWGRAFAFTPQSLLGFRVDSMPDPAPPNRPATGLYMGMLSPLVRYPIRGAIWYQGESNAGQAWQYQTLLPTMIADWRKAWAEGPFPFLIVQLANYGQRTAQPSDSGWAELREAQAMALKVPATGLAVTIDVGEGGDIHPHRKAEVGERLALCALDSVYHRKVVASGPTYDSIRAEDNRLRVSFQHLGSGLDVHGKPLRGFAVAGADHKFHWADATVDGDTVVVSSPEVAAPVAVRYAWGDNPECNLYNRDGLPAVPFRTDNWPMITQPK